MSQEVEKTITVHNSPEEAMAAAIEAQKANSGGGASAGAAETTKAETAKSDSTEFNEAEYLKRNFGEEFVNVDLIKQRLSSASLDKDIEALLPDVRFVKENPEAFELAKVAAKDPGRVESYLQAMKMDIGKMSDLDKLVKQQALQFNLPEDKVRIALEAKYKLDEDGHYTDTEKVIEEIRLRQDAVAAEQFLQDFQNKAKLPEPQRKLAEDAEKTAQNVERNRAAWKPKIDALASGLKIDNSQVFDYGSDKVPVDFNYELSEADRTEYRNILESIVSNGGFEANDKNAEQIQAMASAVFMRNQFPKIASAIGNAVLKQFHTQIGHKFYNIPPKETSTGGSGAGNGSVKETQQIEKPLRASDF